jgi:hypothetical protein
MMESKSRWYYENHGKAEGPISTLELVKKIQDGDLSLMDLVFKEGDGQWMPAEHFLEITGLVKSAATDFKVDADWVVLRTIEVDGRNQYDQIGPFTIEQVLQLIDKGKVKFTDFVWREGYENWVPLGHLDKFENPLESSVRVDMSIYEKPRVEDLNATTKPAQFFKPVRKIRPLPVEPPPPEAKGEDLAKEKWQIDLPPKVKAVEVKTPEVKAPEKVSVPEPKVTATEPSETPRRRRKDDNEVKESLSETEKASAKKEQIEVAKRRWSSVASAVAMFIFLCGGTLVVFFGHKAYRTHQARAQKMIFEPVATVTQRPRKKEPAPVAKAPPVEAALEAAVEAPVVLPPKEIKKVSEFAEMTTKQKAYFYNSERLFLFYGSQKGLKLVSEVDKILKPQKTKKKPSQKSQVEAWATKVQTLHQSVMAESKSERLYPDLYKRLSSVTQQLNERSQDLRSQIVNGRGPSKEWTLQEVAAEYKKLLKLAQDLD